MNRINKFPVVLFFLFFLIFLIRPDGFAAGTIKVLAIGNSFSVDAAEAYLDDLAKAAGVKMIIGNCNLGGCSLQRHQEIASGDSAMYAYRKIVDGDSTLLMNKTLKYCIEDEDWDYITFQQVSYLAGMPDTYFPYITELMTFVLKYARNPNLRFALHQTWAYAAGSTHPGFRNYHQDQEQMYNSVIDAGKQVRKKTGIKIILPSGTAIQNLRNTQVGDNLCRDGFHLSFGLGRYTAACVWFETLTGISVINNTFKPAGVSTEDARLAQLSAHQAVKTPFRITDTTQAAKKSGVTAGKETIFLSGKQITDNSDITAIIRDVLSKMNDKQVRLVFPKGTYHFSADKAPERFLNITNHDNGQKRIAFNLCGLKNIEIDGQGSEFIFHGEIMPFLIEACSNITLKNFTIDWAIPFYIQGEVINTDPVEGWLELNMFKKGFSYALDGEHLRFPIDNNVRPFQSPGESLAFDKATKSPVYHADIYDLHRQSGIRVRQLPDSNLVFYEKLKNYPPLHAVLVFKGPMGKNRYAPAFHCLESKNVLIRNVTVYHAPGMGFLGERSENIRLDRFNVKLREGTDRYVSTTADATHFANCRGTVLLDHCIFENMLDDGTNVHGTYMEIDSVIDNKTIRAKFGHFQQAGFDFAKRNEKIWFLIAPDPSRSHENTVAGIKKTDDLNYVISVKSKLPANIKKGDLIENKTYNTSRFIMQHCTLRNHRARNIVLKTPGSILIRNNYFESMMASILIRGEARMWYESGAVDHVVIRNNYFGNCVSGGGEQAVLTVSPRLNQKFGTTYLFDKNIVFRNNTINSFNNKTVEAERVDRLIIRNNHIIQNKEYPPFNTGSSLFGIRNCRNLVIKNNNYQGQHHLQLDIDTASMKSAKVEGTNGFTVAK